jgi:hypothetical protein
MDGRLWVYVYIYDVERDLQRDIKRGRGEVNKREDLFWGCVIEKCGSEVK